MNTEEILKELAVVSKRHLELLEEEKWEEWEGLCDKKAQLYKDLRTSLRRNKGPLETAIVEEIRCMEEEAVKILEGKKSATKAEISRIRQARNVLRRQRNLRKGKTAGSGQRGLRLIA